MSVELPERGSGERRRRREARETAEERAARLRKVGIVLAVLALTTAVPVLGYVGFHQVLQSTGGHKVDAVNDPTKPGYEANVVPTPVELVAQLGADGQLASLTLLALSRGDAGGNIVLVPVGTQLQATGANATDTLATTYRTGGTFGLQRAANGLLGFGVDELTVIDDARWASLTAAAAPLPIDNPDRVRTPAFAQGPIDLAASDVGPYLAARNAGESDLTRLARHEVFWTAWLHAIAMSSRADVLPGESGTGLDHVLRTLAKGAVAVDTLPVTATGVGADETLTPKLAADKALLASAVPFPTGTIDQPRIKVRLLDGVDNSSVIGAAAALVVPAGAEVDIAGNADHFGYEMTVIRYNADDDAAAAQQLRDAIGVGDVVQGQQLDDAAQVTIVLGRDFAARYGSARDGSASSSSPTAS